MDFKHTFCILFCIFGAVYGFVLEWGPLIWGLIGIVAGIALGHVIKLLTIRKYSQNRQRNKKSSEAVVIIECKDHQLDMVKNTLWEHYARGVRKLDLQGNE